MVQCIQYMFTSRAVKCISSRLRQMANARFFFFVVCISFALSICIQLVNREESLSINENLIQEALDYASLDARYAEVYRKPSRLPKNLKYLLLWTPKNFAPFYYFGKGQRIFITNNCSVINCYVTNDRNFFGGDTTRFDAIAFNGRNILQMNRSHLPVKRSSRQKYIFFNMESADNYPVCNKVFDDFFNWTSTYKLNSDIPYPYVQIKNYDREVVGPKQNMDWSNEEEMTGVDEELSYKLRNKTKAVAWFVSHCYSRSGRKKFVKKLKSALAPYKLSVDVYGKCGTLQCPLNKKSDCDLMLEKDYFFYLSMENSFSEDYVTEKLLTPLQHDVVPIVYGGADYSRFLPPGSYLNAMEHTPIQLAAMIAKYVTTPSLYRNFFRWKYHYSYHEPIYVDNVCAVCATLNNKSMFENPKVYKNFRSWWNPDYAQQCLNRNDLY